MKIEVWSDFVCPFCYIGKRRLEDAINQFEYKDEVEVIFRSFELDPNAKKRYQENIHELIAKKYDIPLEQAKASNDQIVAQAKAIGLEYNFDDIIPTNTYNAHRLTHYAKEEGKMNELSERLLKAYFVDCLDLSDHKVLASLAKEVGLKEDKAFEVLESNQYGSEVRDDEDDANRLRISGVPYFIFDRKYAVSGAQPSDIFLEVLMKVREEEISFKEENPLTKPKTNEEKDTHSGICEDGKCEITD